MAVFPTVLLQAIFIPALISQVMAIQSTTGGTKFQKKFASHLVSADDMGDFIPESAGDGMTSPLGVNAEGGEPWKSAAVVSVRLEDVGGIQVQRVQRSSGMKIFQTTDPVHVWYYNEATDFEGLQIHDLDPTNLPKKGETLREEKREAASTRMPKNDVQSFKSTHSHLRGNTESLASSQRKRTLTG
eukprot:TRINITY_DN3090_c0_g1_i1.p1 TRINITY_DN3090_c0_g1~~TRINITY_DN3090_c0_g1_i1.p1  ORF type:complete len:186 (-),score=20.66 TRINITY_DN3090_c0_g1_i1:234-791(-)